MKNWQVTIAAAAIWMGTTVGVSMAQEHTAIARQTAQDTPAIEMSTAGQSWQALQGVEATPLQTQEMDKIKGKGMTLSTFLAQATRVNLGSGVYVWGYSSDGNPFGVTATWNTGSSSGTGSVVFSK